jgi:putative endonuclease
MPSIVIPAERRKAREPGPKSHGARCFATATHRSTSPDAFQGIGRLLAYYVYILASRPRGTLYIGVTNDLVRRVYEHRNDLVGGFTAQHGVRCLVSYEVSDDVYEAISREKRLKRWRRSWKIELIETQNEDWHDLWPAIAQP